MISLNDFLRDYGKGNPGNLFNFSSDYPYFFMSEGVKRAVDIFDLNWLLEIICSFQSSSVFKNMDSQVWVLQRANEKLRYSFITYSFVVTCLDNTGAEMQKLDIEYCDFPMDYFKVLLNENIFQLPTEV